MQDSTEDEKKWLIITAIKEARLYLDELYHNIEEHNLIQELHIKLEKRFDEESEEWRDAF